MDPITHGLMGALLAAVFGLHRGYGLIAVAALVAASMAPDLDALPIIAGQKYFYQYHRVLFHSLAGGLLLALALSAIIYVFTTIKDYRVALGLSLAGVGLHIVVDLLASWGIPLLYPFNSHRYSLDLVWFIDLSTIFIATVALSLIRANPRNTTR